ncbi:hypothetical protein EMIHUDRAFT_220103 [Emiliania huxleyi CCMP1516]|uniref:Cyclic nucleotide-binding domain-containing protein n=2 Tax=Emiliania huxleyi TaxID=2903 RepID=A0A0D3I306_EMIH1|nr:hypothetical protein EMIHUDRAFT_220103 [Emiliania huxleyi CCMP1516]EOD05641.1 hypothetical protein EMIHUDRAFT_220103 [Emiliania huxleyi CCMP1516]|eukprot:XP_005758070.1 hypothetical protein EMIHUDRAFT_220103 [Emiliania huxleyi CCMP1516]
MIEQPPVSSRSRYAFFSVTVLLAVLLVIVSHSRTADSGAALKTLGADSDESALGSIALLGSRLESFNQCMALRNSYFLKLAINEFFATTLWSDIDPETPDASMDRDPFPEPTELSGPPLGSGCLLACAENLGGELRTNWPQALWSLGGWLGAANETTNWLGSALGGSSCGEVHTIHDLGGSINGVQGLELVDLDVSPGHSCHPAATAFNVMGRLTLAVGAGAPDFGSALGSAIDEALLSRRKRRGEGKLEIRSAVASHSVCKIGGDARPNASLEVGPLTLGAWLYNVTLSSSFAMSIAACSVTSIKVSDVDVGWEAASVGHRAGRDIRGDAPFSSVRLGAYGGGLGRVFDDDDDESTDDNVREADLWASVQSFDPGAAMRTLDGLYMRPQISASLQSALNRILSDSLPQQLCDRGSAEGMGEYANKLATSSSAAGAGLKAGFGSRFTRLSKAGAELRGAASTGWQQNQQNVAEGWADVRRVASYTSFLEHVQLFKQLSKMQRDRLVGSLEEVVYQPGEDIITEGEVGTHFYLIVEGQVSVTKAGQEGVLARRSTGDYFGERALRTGEKTTATVSATGATPVRLVRLDRWAYEHMLSPVDDLLPLRKYSSPPTAPPLAALPTKVWWSN